MHGTLSRGKFIIIYDCASHWPCAWDGGRGRLYFRLDIIFVKGLSKYTLSTNFTGMRINPKYAFLHDWFLIFLASFSKIYDLCQKHTLFFSNFWHFSSLKDICAYIARSWKTPDYFFHIKRVISTLKYKCPHPLVYDASHWKGGLCNSYISLISSSWQ